MTNIRPDFCLIANRSAEVTEAKFSDDAQLEQNKSISYIGKTIDHALSYRPLHEDTLHLRAYSDVSFETNDDMNSQIGYSIMLCDASHLCHVPDYHSHKSKLVVISILGVEDNAFTDCFDQSFMIRHYIAQLFAREIPLVGMNGSLQIFEALNK